MSRRSAKTPKPFRWHKSADEILTCIKRFPALLWPRKLGSMGVWLLGEALAELNVGDRPPCDLDEDLATWQRAFDGVSLRSFQELPDG